MRIGAARVATVASLGQQVETVLVVPGDRDIPAPVGRVAGALEVEKDAACKAADATAAGPVTAAAFTALSTEGL